MNLFSFINKSDNDILSKFNEKRFKSIIKIA